MIYRAEWFTHYVNRPRIRSCGKRLSGRLATMFGLQFYWLGFVVTGDFFVIFSLGNLAKDTGPGSGRSYDGSSFAVLTVTSSEEPVCSSSHRPHQNGHHYRNSHNKCRPGSLNNRTGYCRDYWTNRLCCSTQENNGQALSHSRCYSARN